MWNCVWGHALKRSPGIIRKSRVSYPSPGFLSSTIWPSLPKTHYVGLINQIIKNHINNCHYSVRKRQTIFIVATKYDISVHI